eukprot:NODE_21942_length_729_cov_4.707641.p1 GENE.NODE_21942_length_729_cov_4.707641~~NODE_21942_length_729_cov_4.707641.p1  ORF type:complete len:144 (+),score=19.70 NODE_21942_length_729_cov_4.707641:210-641(+)
MPDARTRHCSLNGWPRLGLVQHHTTIGVAVLCLRVWYDNLNTAISSLVVYITAQAGLLKHLDVILAFSTLPPRQERAFGRLRIIMHFSRLYTEGAKLNNHWDSKKKKKKKKRRRGGACVCNKTKTTKKKKTKKRRDETTQNIQ